MPRRVQLTFVPGSLVPAGGRFALWWADPPAAEDRDSVEMDAGPALELLATAAGRLGLPEGEAGTVAGVALAAGRAEPRDRPARLVPVLPAVRSLASLPPGPDWPAWSRPGPSVLAWSVAAKLALELVAAGRILPGLRPADVPGAAIAGWRAAVPPDGRVERLAAAMPVAAHALRQPTGALWTAEELLLAFLDAVADACAREGRDRKSVV